MVIRESKVIQNTVGNIFSGQVVGETAKAYRTVWKSITETPEFNHQSK
jgi:hypothetical protein